MSELSTELLDAKGLMRRAAYDARNAQDNKDRVSEIAVATVVRFGLPFG